MTVEPVHTAHTIAALVSAAASGADAEFAAYLGAQRRSLTGFGVPADLAEEHVRVHQELILRLVAAAPVQAPAMPDPACLLTAAEVAAALRMSERSLRDFLADLGYTRGKRGARRMFTPADFDYLTEQRSWLSQSARGAKSGTRAALSVSVGRPLPSGSSAQAVAREHLLKLSQQRKRLASEPGPHRERAAR